MNSINALVKWGGVAGLHDTAGQQKVLRHDVPDSRHGRPQPQRARLRRPADRNQFLHGQHRREVQPVIDEFRKRGVLVGRPFPPMTQHMRVSVGTDDEMARFMTAFKEIFPPGRSSSNGAQQ